MEDDRSTQARIRDEAMRLFSEHGPDGVSLRTIGAAAGVSAPLIIHHFGSKAGLKVAVDAHVADTLVELFATFADPTSHTDAPSIAGRLESELAGHPHLLDYLRRMLIEGDDIARGLFATLHTATIAMLGQLRNLGALRPTDDPETLAAFLITNDLGAILLRDQIRAVTGSDPTRGDGLRRWSVAVMDVYTHGIFPTNEDLA